MFKAIPFPHRLAAVAFLAVLFVAAPLTAQQTRQSTAPARAKGLTVAGPERPASVPAGFVITPFGYFHPSCALSVEAEDTLQGNGRVKHANGSADAIIQPCSYAHYTRTGLPVPATAAASSQSREPVINGWLEYTQTTTDTWYGGITATWTVPPQPTVNDFQTIFFFPGFEDTINNITIVQPVLQWYYPGPWMLASWNCCEAGNVVESRPVKVSPGDSIYGAVVPMCKKGSGYCPDWKIESQNQTTGRKTGIRNAALDGQVWNWAFGAVLEVYGIKQCIDFPPDSSLTMSVQLYDQNRQLIADPGWSAVPADPGTDPSCPYGVVVTPSDATLQY
jgi:hypothetical protein